MEKKPTYEELEHKIKKLEESERKYRHLFETAMVGMYRTRISDGKFLAANQTLAKLIGYESVDQLISEYVTSEHYTDSKRREELLKQINSKGRVDGFEIEMQRTDGSIFQIAISSAAYPDKGYLEGVVIDITDQKQAEEALRENEKLYRLLADNVTDVIWVRDMNLRPTYFSPSITNQTGYTVEETMARTLEEALTPDSLKLALEVFAEELEIENSEQKDLFRSRTIELEIKCKDGSTIWTEMKMSFLRDQLGNSTGVIGVTRDITDRKNLEAQLKQAQKMEAIGTLAGGIAHDFNNVLYSIIGYTELTMDDLPKDSVAQKNLNEVFKGAMRAKDMVRQILAFSRKAETKKQPVKIQSIVKEAINLLRSSIPSTIEICHNIDADCSPVLADSTQIHQMVMNLSTNAYQAMREMGGVLELTLMEEEVGSDDPDLDLDPGTYLKLTVSDTGHGIDRVLVEKIFDPYFTTRGPEWALQWYTGLSKATAGILKYTANLGKALYFMSIFP